MNLLSLLVLVLVIVILIEHEMSTSMITKKR